MLQVNDVPVEGKTHSQVVAAIKDGGEEARLLVVDTDTDAFFKRCRVTPTSEHLTGETTSALSGQFRSRVSRKLLKNVNAGHSVLALLPFNLISLFSSLPLSCVCFSAEDHRH